MFVIPSRSRRIGERWANWLRQDPAVAIETEADNLRRLKALYIDCGEKDQFNLDQELACGDRVLAWAGAGT